MFKYLTSTKNYIIVFNDQINNSNIKFIKFSNASFVNDLNIRQSFNNYCFKFFHERIN